jgi:hypothetical protein
VRRPSARCGVAGDSALVALSAISFQLITP